MQYRSFLPLGLLCLAPFAIAAPLQVSGYASGYGWDENCYEAITGPNQSVSCQGLGYGATASHSGTQISGSASADAYGGLIYVPWHGPDPDFFSTWGYAQVDILIQNDFVLTGGTGAATLEFGPDAYSAGNFASCYLTVQGTTYFGCYPPEGTINVVFGSPIPITLRLYLDLYGGPDGENWVSASYNLQDIIVKQDGRVIEGALFTPVPEPASVITLSLGLLAVGAYRLSGRGRRVASKQNRSSQARGWTDRHYLMC